MTTVTTVWYGNLLQRGKEFNQVSQFTVKGFPKIFLVWNGAFFFKTLLARFFNAKQLHIVHIS